MHLTVHEFSTCIYTTTQRSLCNILTILCRSGGKTCKQNPPTQSIANANNGKYCQSMVESKETSSPSTPSDPIIQTVTISALLIVCGCVRKVNAFRNHIHNSLCSAMSIKRCANITNYYSINHMWQFWVEIEYYSVAYSITLPHLKCFSAKLSLRAGHVHAV